MSFINNCISECFISVKADWMWYFPIWRTEDSFWRVVYHSPHYGTEHDPLQDGDRFHWSSKPCFEGSVRTDNAYNQHTITTYNHDNINVNNWVSCNINLLTSEVLIAECIPSSSLSIVSEIKTLYRLTKHDALQGKGAFTRSHWPSDMIW